MRGISLESGCLLSRVSAIMRGAVLYKLGLDFVKTRIIRLNYGVSRATPFEEGSHDESRKYEGYDGLILCSGLMDWYVRMVFSPVLVLAQFFRAGLFPVEG